MTQSQDEELRGGGGFTTVESPRRYTRHTRAAIAVVKSAHKPGEAERSSRRGAAKGLITGGLEQRICLGQSNGRGSLPESSTKEIGSLRKRPVKLILTKPPGADEVLTQPCSPTEAALYRRRGFDLTVGVLTGRMSNRYSKLRRCNGITHAPPSRTLVHPRPRRVESCARRTEYK